jgi:uncharacterized protein YodC (DUF2158 family)
MDFAAGDVVRLKSGGPLMTVEQIGKHSMTQEDAVWCVWSETVGGNRWSSAIPSRLPCSRRRAPVHARPAFCAGFEVGGGWS